MLQALETRQWGALGARLKGLMLPDRRVESLRVWSQEQPGQACVPQCGGGWRPEWVWEMWERKTGQGSAQWG